MEEARPARGIVTLGASAGGIEALQRLMAGLPHDLAAAVCLVLHIPATSRSLLAQVIARQTVLPVTAVSGGEPLTDGHVYVAPPDRHLRVREGRVELDRGPQENGVRPAIDALFRSAAGGYGERAIAVVLSGALSDGAAGAAAVAAAGGAVLVQDPHDAVVASMPESALAAVPAAVIMSAGELGPEIARRAAERSEDALLAGNSSAIESAPWMALHALERRVELLYMIAERLEAGGRREPAARFREHARSAAERAELVRGAVTADEDPVTGVSGAAA